jgi:hypothetical protein
LTIVSAIKRDLCVFAQMVFPKDAKGGRNDDQVHQLILMPAVASNNGQTDGL